MTDLEKRADKYAKNNEKKLMKGFIEDGGTRTMLCTIPTPHVRKAYLEATKRETKLFSKQILELQKDKGNLIDENRQAKEIIREYMRFEPMIGTCSFYSEEYEKTKKKAEAFLNEEKSK